MPEITILDLPEVALEKILSNLSYEEIANNRLVCRHFNNICGGLLTKGFVHLEKKNAVIYKLAKFYLPKRPSERRSNAVVSRCCEMLQGIETRIRMLGVTYKRYIQQHLICFVPGKVLDEIKRLHGLIENKFVPPSNIHQLLEELRDLSTMAMEHFDEHILPLLEKKDRVYKNSEYSGSKSLDRNALKILRKVYKRNSVLRTQAKYLLSKTRRLTEKWNRQNMRIRKQYSIIKEQNTKLKVQATRLENHEIAISEMKKKMEEMQNSFVDVKIKFEQDNFQKKCTSLSEQSMKSLLDTNSTSINSKKLMQQDSLHPKHNILRKKLFSRHSIDNKNLMNSSHRDERKRKCMSMVDMEIWRRRCPTSRSTYLTYKNFVRNRAEILLSQKQNSNEISPTIVDHDKKSKKPSDFAYKTIIKQRTSRIFPLTSLDLDRKRKSNICSDIPSKQSKISSNESLKVLDQHVPKKDEDKQSNNPDLSNVLSNVEVRRSKRKRHAIGNA